MGILMNVFIVILSLVRSNTGHIIRNLPNAVSIGKRGISRMVF